MSVSDHGADYRYRPHKWSDEDLAQELRFRLRFEKAGSNEPVDSFSQILCEAIARILERGDSKNDEP